MRENALVVSVHTIKCDISKAPNMFPPPFHAQDGTRRTKELRVQKLDA